MQLTIFDNIIFGALQPWQAANQNEQSFTDLLTKVGRDLPVTAENLDKKLRVMLRHNPDVYQHININNDAELQYPIYENFIPKHFNNTTEYYLMLMQLSSLRCINDLIANVQDTNHELDNYYAVNTALEKIKYIAAGAAAELLRHNFTAIPNYTIEANISASDLTNRNTHLILYATKQHSISLFFEVQTRFEQHVKATETEEQFYLTTLKEPYKPTLKPTANFFDWRANKIINSLVYSSQDALDLLDQIREKQQINISAQSIIALENYIFINLYNIQIESRDIADLANPANSVSLFEQVKQIISGEIDQLSYGHQRFDIITEALNNIAFYKPQDLQNQSALLKLHQWLNSQAQAYKGNLSNSFAVTDDNTKQTSKAQPLPKAEKKTVETLKQQAQEFLKHFSGHSIHQKKIMYDADYNRLIQYTFHLIEHEKLPEEIKQIPTIELSGNHIRYTYYLMHKSFYGTTEIKPVWIDFLQKVFTQFSGQEWNTLKTKFSQKPPKYDQDIAALNN